MEAQDSARELSNQSPAMADYLQELGFTPAASRAPKTIIAKAQDLTGFQIWLLLDLNTEWAKIEEGTGDFFKAVFSKWNSSCVVVSLDGKKPTLDKPEKGLIVGTWKKDLAESRASIAKRKKEGKDESEAKPSKFRKTGKDASTFSTAKCKWPRAKAEAQCAHIYDQAEIMRLDTHNKTTLVALARQRIDWFKYCNAHDPVPANDPGLRRFQAGIKSLIEKLVDWSNSSDEMAISHWMKLPRTERAMTRGFRNILMQSDAAQLASAILNKIPKKSQQILGRQEVTPIDLLDLPRVPNKFPHRLTYVDVAADVGPSNVGMMPTLLHPSTPVKAVNPGAQIQPTMDTRLYIGSSLAGRGGYTRLQVHEKESNRGTPGTGGMHYGFTRQAGVVPSYRVVGVWTNPNRLRSDGQVVQDLERWLPVFFEGLLMVYLGTYHATHRSTQDQYADLFSESSYKLVTQLRSDLDLPDLYPVSLNRAWPSMQTVNGGMVWADGCANPECQRPAWKYSFNPPFPDFIGTCRLLPLARPLSERFCVACCKYARKHGAMRTRKGLANGLWLEESGTKRNDINQA
ncbi:hypothetical protein CEP54_002460 [Fusarium duplospermum]|uniref:Uncharacterized protein n=1 Tax=Fusarium duplospermum TaxID=1325734 RepID=A0A428QV45_9HYPO|nr:hypothetical protein CEP54_002460 [Fusarium duplospermum]